MHRIEILTFDGCPNRATALDLVAEVVAREGVEADVRVVDVPDLEAARRLRFLGSPTISDHNAGDGRAILRARTTPTTRQIAPVARIPSSSCNHDGPTPSNVGFRIPSSTV